MKYALRGITAEELSYTMNRIQIAPNTRFELKPQFARQIRRVKENDKLYFLVLEVKIESTEESSTDFVYYFCAVVITFLLVMFIINKIKKYKREHV